MEASISSTPIDGEALEEFVARKPCFDASSVRPARSASRSSDSTRRMLPPSRYASGPGPLCSQGDVRSPRAPNLNSRAAFASPSAEKLTSARAAASPPSGGGGLAGLCNCKMLGWLHSVCLHHRTIWPQLLCDSLTRGRGAVLVRRYTSEKPLWCTSKHITEQQGCTLCRCRFEYSWAHNDMMVLIFSGHPRYDHQQSTAHV